MNKRIKFNLMLDGKPIRDLLGLQENFNICELLVYYKNGLLFRWLSVRGYDSLAQSVAQISSDNDLDAMTHLATIFEIETDPEKMKSALYPFELKEARMRMLKDFEASELKAEKIIESYHTGYDQLKADMLENHQSLIFLKYAVQELGLRYVELFRMDRHNFYKEFSEQAPLAIFAVFMNPMLKQIFLKDPIIKNKICTLLTPRSQVIQDIFMEYQKTKNIKDVYAPYVGFVQKFTEHEWTKISDEKVLILSVSQSAKVTGKNDPPLVQNKKESFPSPVGKVFFGLKYYSDSEYAHVKYLKLDALNAFLGKDLEELELGESLKIFKENTEGFWQEIEPSDKKIMLIRMKENAWIRPVGSIEESLTTRKVNGEFLILDGLEYKTNDPENVLYYMEV